MELGLLLMETSQIFCFSSGALENINKVSQIPLLITYKTKLKLFWVFSLDGGIRAVSTTLWKNNRKNHHKMLTTKQKGKQVWKMLFSHILVCYTFWSVMGMKSKELKYAFRKHFKAFLLCLNRTRNNSSTASLGAHMPLIDRLNPYLNSLSKIKKSLK